MKRIGVSTYQLLSSACAVALFALIAVMPLQASAQAINTQTQQILPPGANTCAPIQISNFTPYIYSNELNSFEFTVADPSYVAVVGSVGNTSIPLRYMTRRPAVSGSGVVIHVDIDSTPLTGSVPVTITLLSAKSGAPVCAAVVSVNLGSGTSVPSSSTSTPTYPSAPATTPTTSHPTTSSNQPATTTTGQGSVATTGTPVVAPVTSTLHNPISDLCTSQASAYRLWLILLVLYALVVGGLLWLEFPLSWNWAKTPERVATIILILLVLLLGFWYLSSACRAALWMPLLAFLIAILGLLAAFCNHPRVTELLLLEEKKTTMSAAHGTTVKQTSTTTVTTSKAPIITPPPVKK